MSMTTLPVEQLIEKASKFAEENPLAVGVSAVVTLAASVLIMRKATMTRDGNDYESSIAISKLLNNTDHTIKGKEFETSIKDYESMFSGARDTTGAITSEESIEVRKAKYADMVNHFYNLVTDFYEWGWGQSFHFGPRWKNETFMESLKRAEYHLASRLSLVPGMKVLDVGCGVGGPMRNIAAFSGSTVEGITINQYQVNIGNKYNENNGLAHLCKLTQGDFQSLPWADEHFDAAYEIEATCHSPDRVQTFGGIHRVLKKGSLFAGYEWVVLPQYDATNKDHVRIKEGIEVGNGLPTLVPGHVINENLQAAGFEVLASYDANRGVHAANEIPWYETLNGEMSMTGFRMTHVGRMCTHTMVWTLELVGIAPPGSTRVSALLNATAIDLCDGGKMQIFTPSYFFLARKK
ncbi:sterol methyltransferase [Ochromonadaceae sp. CCMP2298]|nr:sterol methyltransferase [Ochromonadaceae sp. CCMP2298]|mmetsp:Transcript_237/g.476  ORF Transcript_237/g.476 Transcript_237/m.476 type:complete len:407 (+) Transcript_237:71-1291(+)